MPKGLAERDLAAFSFEFDLDDPSTEAMSRKLGRLLARCQYADTFVVRFEDAGNGNGRITVARDGRVMHEVCGGGNRRD